MAQSQFWAANVIYGVQTSETAPLTFETINRYVRAAQDIPDYNGTYLVIDTLHSNYVNRGIQSLGITWNNAVFWKRDFAKISGNPGTSTQPKYLPSPYLFWDHPAL